MVEPRLPGCYERQEQVYSCPYVSVVLGMRPIRYLKNTISMAHLRKYPHKVVRTRIVFLRDCANIRT